MQSYPKILVSNSTNVKTHHPPFLTLFNIVIFVVGLGAAKLYREIGNDTFPTAKVYLTQNIELEYFLAIIQTTTTDRFKYFSIYLKLILFLCVK